MEWAAYIDLPVAIEGQIGLTIESEADPSVSGMTTFKLSRLYDPNDPNAGMEEMNMVQVQGSGPAHLSIDEGLSEGDVVRLDIHFQADAPPPPPPGGGEVRKLYIPEIVHSVIVKAAQTYIALSCDTDGAWRENYRYGFNGQQKDNEIAGVGNHNTAQFWEYDTRLGRRWNLDPKPQISISDYTAFGNNPVFNMDINGDYFTEAKGSDGLKKVELVKEKAQKNIANYRAKLAESKNSPEQTAYLNALITQTQGTVDRINSMENSNIEFHLTNGGETATWNPDERRVEIGTSGAGVNGPDDLGALPHELEHGHQYMTGELAGFIGSASAGALYDLSDEYNAAWRGSLLSGEKDFSRWHGTAEGRTYQEYMSTETGPQSGHPNLAKRITAISVGSSATVLLEMKNNILSASAYQVLKANPQATVGDAIKYFNAFRQAHGSSERVLVGKDLENR